MMGSGTAVTFDVDFQGFPLQTRKAASNAEQLYMLWSDQSGPTHTARLAIVSSNQISFVAQMKGLMQPDHQQVPSCSVHWLTMILRKQLEILIGENCLIAFQAGSLNFIWANYYNS